MPKRHTFILNDERVLNSYGFPVLTSGIILKQYKRNPLVLWMHKRPDRWEGNNKDTERFPIGLGYDVRKDPDNPALMLVDVEFDQNDEFAKKIEEKVESKHIRMCSAGLEPITFSEDPKYLLPGQTRRSLIKSALVEVSIVPFGANPNSVKLYGSDMEGVELSADNVDSVIPLLSENNTDTKPNLKDMSDKKENLLIMLGAGLGMDENTSESDMLRHVINLNAENTTLKTKVTQLEQEKTDIQTATELSAKNSILDEAVKFKKITEAQRPVYAKMDLADMKVILDGLQPTVDLSKIPGSEGEGGKGAWEKRMDEINNK
ncbi:MAG: HK97 family phage prohead protease [Salinivirgaceae bacterium]|nr:HK97 family phage prohead protease [Salinivirgaceae bacterium]